MENKKLEWIGEEHNGEVDSWTAEGFGKRTYSIFNDGTQYIALIDDCEFEYDRPVDRLKEMCQEVDDDLCK